MTIYKPIFKRIKNHIITDNNIAISYCNSINSKDLSIKHFLDDFIINFQKQYNLLLEEEYNIFIDLGITKELVITKDKRTWTSF